ncbi:hypothetical protein RADP37_05493 (plasmid) [Roseomonas mucosa]|uniref:Uncharacterized protein n=1 Tax=Roseomonas mucosa TaxID=207340 RepID=A0A4Y1MPT2_9PROT|nr:hypothetical protein RADP37_05493 [Roseomonas mucosa]
MSDDSELQALKQEVSELRAQIEALTAWRNRAPDIMAPPDRPHFHIDKCKHFARKFIGREAEELALLYQCKLQDIQFDIDWMMPFTTNLGVGPEQFATQFKAMRAFCFPGVMTDDPVVAKMLDDKNGTGDNPLDSRKKT